MSEHYSQRVETVVVPKPVIVWIKLRSMLDAVIRIKGLYSGREYIFDGAGSEVDVEQQDVEWLLEKRQGKGCCGGGGGQQVFELVGE